MYRILIIKDEDNITESIKEDLETHGYEVNTASDGEIGLEMFEENKYDLILLDLKIPKMTSKEVLREIRQKDPYIYVLIYSDCTEFEPLVELVNIGIDGCIDKTELGELLNMIQIALDPIVGCFR